MNNGFKSVFGYRHCDLASEKCMVIIYNFVSDAKITWVSSSMWENLLNTIVLRRLATYILFFFDNLPIKFTENHNFFQTKFVGYVT